MGFQNAAFMDAENGYSKVKKKKKLPSLLFSLAPEMAALLSLWRPS